MPVKEILLLGNPILRRKCEKVRNLSHRSVHRTIDDLRDTLADFRKRRGFGSGIAAPQIGISQRIIFLNLDGPLPLINPRIVKRSRSFMTLWDDCFSFPDILVKVRRHVNVSVEYFDGQGKRHSLTAAGRLSELLQHEIDHIDGILALDRAIDSKHIILRSEWKKIMDSQKTSF